MESIISKEGYERGKAWLDKQLDHVIKNCNSKEEAEEHVRAMYVIADTYLSILAPVKEPDREIKTLELSHMTDAEKDEVIKNVMLSAGTSLAATFISVGLKTHM